jgi:hypothetical protein
VGVSEGVRVARQRAVGQVWSSGAAIFGVVRCTRAPSDFGSGLMNGRVGRALDERFSEVGVTWVRTACQPGVWWG